MPKHIVQIYGPGELPIGTLDITWPDDTEEADIVADTTEAVVTWCSDKGLSYDECDWEYIA